jgi:hypothetical protein
VWDGHGSPENFLCHMQGMRDALEDMGLFKKYEEARQKVSRVKEQVQEQKDLQGGGEAQRGNQRVQGSCCYSQIRSGGGQGHHLFNKG